ncbi:class I glutamine amidotransferase-like protein [Cunninghamella echinulata]|nr:class I glutamine amidotransferase-like protein [Cunninghamella echinulata]
MVKLHLALLVCDTPKPFIVEKYGDYPCMFQKVFNAAVTEEKDVQVTWEFFDVVHKQDYPKDISLFDGIVITGSAASAYNDDPWILKLVSFLQEQFNHPKKVKIVGVCFGHQIIARAAGGKCEKNINGWEFGYTEIDLTPIGKQFFKTDKSILRLNQVHQDHVSELPAGYQVLASTAHTPIHSFLSADGQCITIQGHPEYNRDTVRMFLQFRRDAGIISREFAEKALAKLDSVGPEMEDVWLVCYFLDFLQGKLALNES